MTRASASSRERSRNEPTSPSTWAGRDRGADLVDVRGAVVAPGDQVAIIATGSEVEVAVAARQLLADEGISARVVSLPSFELFFERPQGEREDILPTPIPPGGRGGGEPVRLVGADAGRGGHDDVRQIGQGTGSVRFLGITPEAVAVSVREVPGR